jgi:hypothetical protein
MIIGLNGYAQAGKDTAGDYMVEGLGFVGAAYADKLRDLMTQADPWVQWGSTWVRWNEAVRLIGYERAKKETNGRDILVNLGHGVRNVLGQDTWVDAAMSDVIPTRDYVFTDVRYPNEALAIKNAGGEVWRIWRPGNGPALDEFGDPFISEVLLEDWIFDYEMANDGSILDLKHKVYAAVQDVRRGTMVR